MRRTISTRILAPHKHKNTNTHTRTLKHASSDAYLFHLLKLFLTLIVLNGQRREGLRENRKRKRLSVYVYVCVCDGAHHVSIALLLK